MNEEITVAFAVDALQLICSRGSVTPDEARELLAAFGGVPHTGKAGEEMYLFVGQTWDVEVLTFPHNPNRVTLWKVTTPD